MLKQHKNIECIDFDLNGLVPYKVVYQKQFMVGTVHRDFSRVSIVLAKDVSDAMRIVKDGEDNKLAQDDIRHPEYMDKKYIGLTFKSIKPIDSIKSNSYKLSIMYSAEKCEKENS